MRRLLRSRSTFFWNSAIVFAWYRLEIQAKSELFQWHSVKISKMILAPIPSFPTSTSRVFENVLPKWTRMQGGTSPVAKKFLIRFMGRHPSIRYNLSISRCFERVYEPRCRVLSKTMNSIVRCNNISSFFRQQGSLAAQWCETIVLLPLESCWALQE